MHRIYSQEFEVRESAIGGTSSLRPNDPDGQVPCFLRLKNPASMNGIYGLLVDGAIEFDLLLYEVFGS